MTEHFFLLRLVRNGPLMPVRFFDCAHEPGDPENPRDRWPTVIRAAEIAGEWYDPKARKNSRDPFEKDLTEDPVAELEARQWATAEWKVAVPIPAWRYKFLTAEIVYSREWRPNDPRLRPWRRVRAKDIPPPVFKEETA
jgi:hypothetical protein